MSDDRKQGARLSAMSERFERIPRVLVLTLVALTVVGLVVGLDMLVVGGGLTRQFFSPAADKGPEWKDLFQAMLILMGLPVGLTLWYWRDLSVRHQIENARKDTTLKEFSELQMRAAGAIDESFPYEARIALQVAALHQLRPYLRGQSGRSFQLAAFEIYCSILACRVRGSQDEEDAAADAAEQDGGMLESAIDGRLHRTIRAIVQDEWRAFFLSDLPLDNRSLKGLKLPYDLRLTGVSIVNSSFDKMIVSGGAIKDCHFLGCSFSGASFNGASIDKTAFLICKFDSVTAIGSSLSGSRLDDVDLSRANWIGCKFQSVKFMSCRMNWIKFENCFFGSCVMHKCEFMSGRFSYSEFSYCMFADARVHGLKATVVHMDASNSFAEEAKGSDYFHEIGISWERSNQSRRDSLLEPWRAAGVSFEFEVPRSRTVDELMASRSQR